MKARHLGLFFLALLVIFGIACKTTPPEPEPEWVPPPPPPRPPRIVVTAEPDPYSMQADQASLDYLAATITKAEEARQIVQDFNGPIYFPAEWDDAEYMYEIAQTTRAVTQGEVRQATVLYESVAQAYEDLLNKTVPRYANVLMNEVLSARESAIEAGAGYLAYDYLSGTDDFANGAWRKYQNRDFYGAREDGILVLDAYKVMVTGLDAYKVRLELEDRDFVKYDSMNIGNADNIAFSALADYESHQIYSAGSKANDVRSRYNQSLFRAKESFSSDMAAAANSERQTAWDLRANVASRVPFENADGIFNLGGLAAQNRSFDQSASLYIQSRTMFEAIVIDVRERRRLAEEALRAAERKMIESEEIAHRAELIIEGGAK